MIFEKVNGINKEIVNIYKDYKNIDFRYENVSGINKITYERLPKVIPLIEDGIATKWLNSIGAGCVWGNTYTITVKYGVSFGGKGCVSIYAQRNGFVLNGRGAAKDEVIKKYYKIYGRYPRLTVIHYNQANGSVYNSGFQKWDGRVVHSNVFSKNAWQTYKFPYDIRLDQGSIWFGYTYSSNDYSTTARTTYINKMFLS